MTQPATHRPETPPPAAERRWSIAVAALAVLGALVSLLAATSWARQRQDLLEMVASAGIDDPQLIRRLERESTPHQARLVAARALIYNTLSVHGRQPDQRRQALIDKLPESGRLARSVLEAQPNSWQAAMLLGTATYLQWSIDRDDRLYTEAEAWEKPLQKAVRDAAGHPEPRRILATAYLEIWHALGDAKKQQAQALLERVFEDDLRAFEVLAPIWLGLDLEVEVSLQVVPEDPAAWQMVERAFAQSHDWQPFIIAHQRRLDALHTKLKAARDEGELRLRLGEFVDSRSMLLRVVQQAPPSARFLPLVASCLELYPPGLHGLATTTHLEPWVDWSLELSRLGLEGLPPKAMGLLLDAIVSEDFPSSKAALMALMAEDRYQAERFEKLAQPLTLFEWAPYLIAKVHHRVAAGDAQGAREALAQVALAARGQLPYLIAARRAADAVGDLPAEAEIRERLEAAHKDAWRGSEWRPRGNRSTLDVLPSRAADGFEIEILEAPAHGAVVDVRWDGNTLALREARPGARLRLVVPIDQRPHFLELRSLAGGRVIPGQVSLR